MRYLLLLIASIVFLNAFSMGVGISCGKGNTKLDYNGKNGVLSLGKDFTSVGANVYSNINVSKNIEIGIQGSIYNLIYDSPLFDDRKNDFIEGVGILTRYNTPIRIGYIMEPSIFMVLGSYLYKDTGEYTDDGFLVFKNSKANLEESKTAGTWVTEMRKNLIEKGILKQEGSLLIFTEDYLFNSPSASAAVILARHANGWTEWKDKNGKTMDEKIRKNSSFS